MQSRLLTSENFPTECFSQMARLRRADRFTDVSLHCGELSFSAHRVVVAAGSAYLDRVLARTARTSPMIGHTLVILKDGSADVVRFILDFLYLGKVTVPGDKFDEFLAMAKNLELRGLNTTPAPAVSMPQLREKTEKATVTSSVVPILKPIPMRTAIFAPPAKRLGSAQVFQNPPKKPSPSSSMTSVNSETVDLLKVEPQQAPLASPELLDIPFADDDKKSEASSDVSHVSASKSDQKSKLEASTSRVIPIVLIPEVVKLQKPVDAKEDMPGVHDVSMTDVDYPKDLMKNIPPNAAKKTLERVTEHIWCGWLEKNGFCDGTVYFCSLCGYRNPLMCNARRHERIHDGENAVPDRSLSPQAMLDASIRHQQPVLGKPEISTMKGTRVTAL